jgi:DNA repair exonuclease SbcCD nuclease subunit
VKIAAFADLHVRGKDLEAFRRQWRKSIDIANDEGCTAVVVAGDWFDRSNIGDKHDSTGAQVDAILEGARRIDATIYGIPGNHDYDNPSQAPATDCLSARAGFVIEKNIAWIMIGDVAVLCVPWSWDRSIDADSCIRSAWPVRPKARRYCLLAHAQVPGARMGAIVCQKHDTWQISRELLDEIPFDRVWLGDFHKRQDLTGGRGGYIGALRQLNFGEEGNPAGFEIWDSEMNTSEWIYVDEAPVHQTVRVATAQDAVFDREPNVIYRVIVEPGADLSPTEMKRLETDGVQVEQYVEYNERMGRAGEIPEGIINRPVDLLRLWNEKQLSPLPADEMAALEAML